MSDRTAYNRARYLANKEAIATRAKLWNAANPTKRLATVMRFRAKHRKPLDTVARGDSFRPYMCPRIFASCAVSATLKREIVLTLKHTRNYFNEQ